MVLLQTTIDGLLFGSSYALLALGFSLIFGIMRRINLAYGSSLLLGAALAIWLEPMLGWGAFGIFLMTVLGSTLAGIYVERLCFAPHSGRTGAIASMIASFAIWMQLDEISSQLLPHRTHDYPGLEMSSVEFIGMFLRGDQLLYLVIAFATMGLLYLFLNKTRVGLLLRAASDNPSTAFLLGARVGRLGMATFALAGLLGGTASFLILSGDSQVTPFFGLWSTFKGLVAMMLGGVGSLPGAVLGGLLLGLVEAYVLYGFGAEYRDISTFGLLFLILIVRPGGLMGVAIYRAGRMTEERI